MCIVLLSIGEFQLFSQTNYTNGAFFFVGLCNHWIHSRTIITEKQYNNTHIQTVRGWNTHAYLKYTCHVIGAFVKYFARTTFTPCNWWLKCRICIITFSPMRLVWIEIQRAKCDWFKWMFSIEIGFSSVCLVMFIYFNIQISLLKFPSFIFHSMISFFSLCHENIHWFNN